MIIDVPVKETRSDIFGILSWPTRSSTDIDQLSDILSFDKDFHHYLNNFHVRLPSTLSDLWAENYRSEFSSATHWEPSIMMTISGTTLESFLKSVDAYVSGVQDFVYMKPIAKMTVRGKIHSIKKARMRIIEP